jgi:hypothetical protein
MAQRFYRTAFVLMCVTTASVGCASIPDALNVGADKRLVLTATAKGEWSYLCRVSADGKSMSWDPMVATAELLDGAGQPVGHLAAGPSFTHRDGSQADAMRKAAVTPSAEDPPWVLYTAAPSPGVGVLSNVSSIQQIKTSGGRRPPAGCAGADDLMMEKRVPYSAEFRFYSK